MERFFEIGIGTSRESTETVFVGYLGGDQDDGDVSGEVGCSDTLA